MNTIPDRVRELRRVRAGSLRPHPQNWRKHPPAQRAALQAVLKEIGFAGALLARQCADGSLELIDGHLRAETAPDAEVPVLVVDLSEREAALLLAVHDPLAGLAETNAGLLGEIAAAIEVRNAELRELLDRTIAAAPQPLQPPPLDEPAEPPAWRDLFQIIVECRDEAQQRTLYERFAAEGLKCRLSVL